MSCKCDPVRKSGHECPCKDHPPLPAGSPQRALNPKVCPRPSVPCPGVVPVARTADTARERTKRTRFVPEIAKRRREPLPETEKDDDDDDDDGKDYFQSCVSLEPNRIAPCSKTFPRPPRRVCPAADDPEDPPEVPPCRKSANEERRKFKPLRKKRRPLGGVAGTRGASDPATALCGEAGQDSELARGIKKMSALERTISRTQWRDEEGYHVTEVSFSHLCKPEEYKGVAGCSGGERRRRRLRLKLKELLADTQLVPENILPENLDARPEPEVLAAALLMSVEEGGGQDLGSIRPERIFKKLFSRPAGTAESATIASAVPLPVTNIAVPVTVQGYTQSGGLEIPNMAEILKQTRTAPVVEPNAFQTSRGAVRLESGSTPDVPVIPRHFGSDVAQNKAEGGGGGGGGLAESMLDRTPRQEPAAAYRNYVQLNGSVKPSWFPGYMQVAPLLPECIRMTADPGEALFQAWHLCRPGHFNDASKSLVNGGC